MFPRRSKGPLRVAALAALVTLLIVPAVPAARAATAVPAARAASVATQQVSPVTPNRGGDAMTCPSGQPCTPPLQPHGGFVQWNPKIYLIFWGPAWDSDTSGAKTDLPQLFNSLAGTALNNILTQYSDPSNTTNPNAYVHNDVQLAGTWIDDQSTPPGNIADSDLAAEAQRAMSVQGWRNDNGANVQFVIVPQAGTSGEMSGTCGHHNYVNNIVVDLVEYPNLTGDTTFDCEYAKGTTVAQGEAEMVRAALHEYAEAATDPVPPVNLTNGPSGWHTTETQFLNPTTWGEFQEIGDLCFNDTGTYSYNPSVYPLDSPNAPPSFNYQDLWDNGAGQSGNKNCGTWYGWDGFPPAGQPRHTVYGVIGNAYYAAWNAASGGSGAIGVYPPVGWPTSEQAPLAGGWKQTFSSGVMYASSGTAYAGALNGPIAADYQSNYEVGGSNSVGWPNGDEHAISGGGHEADFASGAFVSDGGSNTGWVGSAILAAWKSWGGQTGALGFPTGNQQAVSGGLQVAFQHGVIFDDGGSISVSYNGRQVVGHAAHVGDDYPYETLGQFGHTSAGTDAWNEYYGQCDSFTAWKVYENLAGSAVQHPPVVPDPGWTPTNSNVSPVNQFTFGPTGGLGNADAWVQAFSKLGYLHDNIPVPGAVAYWANGAADNQDGMPANPSGLPGSTTGHVGYVTDVYPDGSITVEMYNMKENGEYSVVHMAYGQGYTDNSFGGSFSVPWPTSFIHVADGPSGAASPTEPAVGVVSAGYPAQVKVIGPGSPDFALNTSTWYLQAGHGELGTEEWTHTNGATADSSAVWTPSGLAGSTCYRVDAFVPDNYSDNPVAVYTVTDAKGTVNAAADENVQTNDWSELGVFETNSGGGGLAVKLDDRGVTGQYVAADAMRFWRQSCAGYGNVAPIMLPTSRYGTWASASGHGFWGNMTYAATTGSSMASASATWSPGTLVHGGCYDVRVYVPDDFSDNAAALYFTNDAYFGPFYPQVNENSFTNQFAWIGAFTANSDGTLPVDLFNDGPANQFVAADAVAFVYNPTCRAENGAASRTGLQYSATDLGPGSGLTNFTTAGNWNSYIGYGYADHQLYAADNSGATATWTFYGSANACYTAKAYIPIQGYANNTQATYSFNTQVGVIGTSINQNAGNGWTQFAGNPKIPTGSNGQVNVTLTAAGPGGEYTAADAINFVQTAC